MIVLKEITNKNIWQVCRLQPFDYQKGFIASNINSIVEAFATRNEGNNALPLAIYDDQELIGFVMIGKGTVNDENEIDLIKDNYCIWRFMIDYKFQGKGYGKEALDVVMNYIKTFPFGPAKYVWLSYEPENKHAKMVYEKYGFKENGLMCDDEIMSVYEL